MFPNRTDSFRSAGVSLAALALALALSGQALADTFDWQRPGSEPAPKTLDQALAAAMQGNPEIAMAKAKLALAEAELSGARFETARKVVYLWGDLQTQKELLEMARHDFDRATRLHKAGSANEEDVNGVRKSLIEVQAKVSRTESELDYLISRGVAEAVSGGGVSAAPATPRTMAAPLQLPHGTPVERIRDALLTRTELNFIKTPLTDVVDYLKDRHKIEIQIDAKALSNAGLKADMPLTIDLKLLTLANALLAMEDQTPELKFVVRDYGILVTSLKRAREQGYFSAVEFAHLGGDGAKAETPTDLQPANGTYEVARPTPATKSKEEPGRKAEKKPGAAIDPF